MSFQGQTFLNSLFVSILSPVYSGNPLNGVVPFWWPRYCVLLQSVPLCQCLFLFAETRETELTCPAWKYLLFSGPSEMMSFHVRPHLLTFIFVKLRRGQTRVWGNAGLQLTFVCMPGHNCMCVDMHISLGSGSQTWIYNRDVIGLGETSGAQE